MDKCTVTCMGMSRDADASVGVITIKRAVLVAGPDTASVFGVGSCAAAYNIIIACMETNADVNRNVKGRGSEKARMIVSTSNSRSMSAGMDVAADLSATSRAAGDRDEEKSMSRSENANGEVKKNVIADPNVGESKSGVSV